MKIFISSDIEGTSGSCNWDEALETDHHKFLGPQMTKEVAAAASAALESGAEEVLVRDAHGGALNIDPAGLPRGARLLRGWAHDIYCMMSGIDRDKYDAVLFTGYHAGAKNPGNPLSHTMHRYIDSITINGEPISEFVMNAYTAGYFGIPVCFISGDKAICAEAERFIPAITAVPVVEGIGGGSISVQPAQAAENIHAGVTAALAGDYRRCAVPMPEKFEATVGYASHIMAYQYSFYPGAKQLSSTRIGFCADSYLEVLRFFHFCAD